MQSERKLNGTYEDVSPEDFKDDTNYVAFQQDSKNVTHDIIPAGVMDLLEDRVNWKNRAAGITAILHSVRELKDVKLLQGNATAVLRVVTTCLNDPHFKIVLITHEVLEEVISKTGPALAGSLKLLVGCLVGKMGDSKCVTKQANMKVFMQLMQILKPQEVVSEALSCGLRHKISRIREETINIVIASLLTFPRTEFDLLMLAKAIAPSLVDNKQRVRQASLEVFALLAHSLGRGHLQPLVSAVASVERSYFGKETEGVSKTEGGSLLGVMVAFQARLARRQLAHLSNDGLVVHAVNVTNTRGSVPFSGADVDWILAAGNSGIHSCTPSAVRKRSSILSDLQSDLSGAGTSQGITPVPSFRPYRSAGKRLPWEIDSQEKECVREDKPRSLVAVVPPRPRIPPTMTLTANGSNNAALNYKEMSYTKQHLAKLRSNQELTLGGENMLSSSLSTTDPYGQVKNGMIPIRHSSLPSDLNMPDSPTARPVIANGSMLHSNELSILQDDSLSLSWPNRHPSNMARKIPLPIKGHLETPGLGDVSQHPVKPTIGRPLSKPRSHNPLLNSIRSSGETSSSCENSSPVEEGGLPRKSTKIRNTVDSELLKNKVQVYNGLGSSGKVKPLDVATRNSPDTWTEDFEDIYEDEFEGNSLCSSAASLLPYKEHELTRSGDIDKVKLLRRQVMSKKAKLLLSADPAMLDSVDSLSATNSPQLDTTTPLVEQQEGVQPKRSHSGDEKRSKPVEKLNKAKPPKARSAGMATINKTKQTIAANNTNTVASHDGDVEVENFSPDTSPVHYQAISKPAGPTTLQPHDRMFKTKQKHISGTDSTAQSLEDAQLTKKTRAEKESDGTAKTFNSSAEEPTTGKVAIAMPKNKPMADTGYAARYSQKRAAEISGKCLEKETLSALREFDVDRPLLSPATRDSMAKKRRCSDKPITNEGLSSSQDTNIISVSAPVRRSKPSSLSSEDAASVTVSDTPDGSNLSSSVACPHDVVTLEELKPFQNPEQALKECQKNMSNPDWNIKCDGLLAVRRLGAFHPEVLVTQLHVTVCSVLAEVKNLRSQVARTAISCLADLFACCGKMLEQDLDQVVKVLLHKGGESSVFIREDVERTLAEMVSTVTPSRCLVALVNGGLHHRSVAVKRSMSCFICTSLERLGADKFLHCSKDVVDKVLPALVQLTTDPSPEARYYARYSLNLLLSHPDFDKTVSRVFNTQHLLSKCKEVMENLKNKGVGDFPSDVQSARKRSLTGSFNSRTSQPRSQESRSGSKATPNHKQRHSAGSVIGSSQCEQTIKKPSRKIKSETQTRFGTSAEMPLPDELLSRLKSTEWKERYQGVTELEQLVDRKPTALSSHIVKVFDAFLPRLTDSNSKVNLHALEAFSNMVPLLGDHLLPIVTSVVEALVPNLASKQTQIHNTAETVLELITQCITPAPLAQPIANAAQYGNSRIQPIMLERLAYLVPFIQNQRPQTVIRHTLPVLFHFVAAKMPPTGQIRLSLLMLCAALDTCLGPELFEHAHHLPPEQLSKLKELMNSATKT